MKKILIDTNVILDIALAREPFVEKAKQLIQLIEKQKISAFISATTVTDIYYITKRKTNHKKAINFIENLLLFVNILSVDENIIIKAMKSKNKDFEDAVQIETAKLNNITSIITRNTKDFVNSEIEIFSPNEYCELNDKI